MSDAPVILYDGVCGLCDRLTRFVIRHDRRRRFRFASLQGGLAARVLPQHGKDPHDLDTLYVVLNRGTSSETMVSRSEAVLFVLRELGGLWRFLGAAFTWLPSSWLDGAYRWVARRRYRIFGRYEACLVPELSDRDRFLDADGDDRQASRESRLLVNP